MKKLLLFLLCFSMMNLYGQLMLNKKFTEIMLSDDVYTSEKVYFQVEERNDTNIFTLNGNLQKPTEIFKFKDNACISYTIVFHKKTSLSCYNEELPDKFYYKEHQFFKRKSAEEIKKIFLRRHPLSPLTAEEKRIIEEFRIMDEQDKLLKEKNFENISEELSDKELLAIKTFNKHNKRNLKITKKPKSFIENKNDIKTKKVKPKKTKKRKMALRKTPRRMKNKKIRNKVKNE